LAEAAYVEARRGADISNLLGWRKTLHHVRRGVFKLSGAADGLCLPIGNADITHRK
jgi:hypothetical protein